MKNIANNKFSKNLRITALFCLIFAVIFSGCVENGQNETDNNSEQNNMDNTTVETEQVITEANNGMSINLRNGETFYLKLRENPSTGYSWQLNVSDGLSILSSEYTQDPSPEEMEGVPGTHQWEIKAVTPGSQQVNGIYKRPWEDTTGTEDNFTLNIEIV
ncbi:MAG: inhibitor of cysteine peptidase [Euryarchaeota archaeon]|nr:inhibitor of cysteine peptidase [Euryarchaeota archaeon]